MINYVCRGALIENNAPFPLSLSLPAPHFTCLHSLLPPRYSAKRSRQLHRRIPLDVYAMSTAAAAACRCCLPSPVPRHSSRTPAVIIKESKNGAARKIAIKCKIADVNDAGSGRGRGSPKSAGCQDTYAQRGRGRHRQSHHRHGWHSLLLLLLLLARKNKLIATRGVRKVRKRGSAETKTEAKTGQGAAGDEQSHCGSLNSQSMQKGGRRNEGRGRRRRDFKKVEAENSLLRMQEELRIKN